MEEIIKTLISEIADSVVAETVKNIEFKVEDTTNDVMTVKELAAYLKVSIGWVYEHMNEIPHVDVGGYKFYKQSIKLWLEDKSKDKKSSVKISNTKSNYKVV